MLNPVEITVPMKAIILTLALLLPFSLQARTFTSSDGSKTIEADLIAYRPDSDTVVFQYKGKSAPTTAKASAFSTEDQEYFQEFLKNAEKRLALKVSTASKSEKFDDEGGIYSYRKEKHHFTITIDNKASFDFADLEVKYDVYVSKFDKNGKKTIEVVSGTNSITEIESKWNARIETEPVITNIECSTSSSCPKCKKKAASVKRERVIGIRIRIYDDEDEMLAEYYSSSATKVAAKKADLQA